MEKAPTKRGGRADATDVVVAGAGGGPPGRQGIGAGVGCDVTGERGPDVPQSG
ncbi:hypothetical protein [Streptomyces paromomycinus]|uniref:Uncharacterized protein n=1 Tax=Streptomyces paromomycinus TaxID=92743 RepID=A0A401W3S6_STREY|nr:hypothetical protein [Streptomyces paromomycinus]GCD43983.1 hypothetical protein GKJPGBOP_03669 [Streptomyces paromomycinus]